MNFGKFKMGQIFSTSTLTLRLNNLPKLKDSIFSKVLSSLPKFHLAKFSPKYVALTLIVVAVIVAGVLIALTNFGKTETFQQNITAETPIDKLFQFPGFAEDGTLTKKLLKLNLTSAAKMKNILIQGKPATARAGKIFLIINLELTNDHQQKLNIVPVDLIRLVDSTGKKFAPDVHNEVVTTEPISVKKTRVGFVVDETTSGLSLQVGEINGPKETVSLAI